MPDALSKTIPIWIAVINRYLFPELPAYHELHTPPDVVSSSEHAQIEERLAGFVNALDALQIARDDLRQRLCTVSYTHLTLPTIYSV